MGRGRPKYLEGDKQMRKLTAAVGLIYLFVFLRAAFTSEFWDIRLGAIFGALLTAVGLLGVAAAEITRESDDDSGH